jgi:phosphoglycerol transferase
MTYADRENGGAFKKNVIPELTALAQENERL